jgi:hypothetical protein
MSSQAYQFNLPRNPIVTFRYAWFSGDGDPTAGEPNRSIALSSKVFRCKSGTRTCAFLMHHATFMPRALWCTNRPRGGAHFALRAA